MPGFIFFVLVAGVVISILVMTTVHTRRVWTDAAQRLGIQLESASLGHPRIAGDIDGLDVLVDVKGSGDNARTRYRVVMPSLGAPFRLKRESATQKIMRALGVDDVQIGEAEFDDAFNVSTEHPDALRVLLTPARRFALLRLFALHPSLVVTEDSLELTTKRVAKDPEKIEGITRRLVATAHAMRGTEATAAVDEALRVRAAGDLKAALTKLQEAAAGNPDDAELHLLAADTALAAGERHTAVTESSAAMEALPGDAEAAGMREIARPQPPARVSPPRSPVPASAAPGTGVDADSMEMFREIFGRSRLSFESGAEFDRTYKGRTVTWSGEVRTTRAFESDLDFGDDPGTKTVVRVAAIASDLYGNTEIDAVVDLPPGLVFDRGDAITFTGTLHKVDAMMRNVFVADATIV